MNREIEGFSSVQADVLPLVREELDDPQAIDAPVARLDRRVEEGIQVERALVREAILLDARVAEDGGLVVANDLAMLDLEIAVAEVDRAEDVLPGTRAESRSSGRGSRPAPASRRG